MPPPSAHALFLSQEAILDAARTLFLGRGYEGVSMDDLAALAGVARRTLYNQFGGKERIFRAMLARQWAVLAAGQDDGGVPLPTREDPALPLRALARTLASRLAKGDQVALVRMVIAESRRQPEIAEDYARLGRQPLLARVRDCLTHLAMAGLITCPDADLAAQQFLGLLAEPLHWPRVLASGGGQADPARVADEAVALFWARHGR
ncbi:TetR/AcrR family transcriptional regulator [Azospirillum sp. B4]|uniref:TetR/AcrR family transcriptional regulator n=1 Tax=Azospirillum sp. B4 TaxID=95605 RepID=UPI0005C859A9|nr:TetR/AcrR family transcriptional regulator [Azospirillum sp. B4]